MYRVRECYRDFNTDGIYTTYVDGVKMFFPAVDFIGIPYRNTPAVHRQAMLLRKQHDDINRVRKFSAGWLAMYEMERAACGK